MFDFPNTPTNGQVVTAPGGQQYSWDGVKWVVVSGVATGWAPLTSPAFTGNPTTPNQTYGDNDTSIANTAFVQAAVSPDRNNVGRNLVHNPYFNIQQRGAGNWTATSSYTADRWTMYLVGATMTVSILTLTDPYRTAIGDEAAVYGLSCIVTAGGAGAIAVVLQRIENIRRLSGKTVTISFWVTANVAAKIGVNIDQIFGTGGSPSAPVGGASQVVNITPTMTRYSVTIAMPSTAGKTFGTNRDDYNVLNFTLSATDNTNIGAQSASFVFWGIQLEIGSVATPLEKIDPGEDLRRCQRFYQVGHVNMYCYTNSGNGFGYYHPFPVAMRAVPTMAQTGTPGYIAAGTPQFLQIRNYGFQPSCVATATGGVAFEWDWSASADL